MQCVLRPGAVSVTVTASPQLSWKPCETNLFEANYFSELTCPSLFQNLPDTEPCVLIPEEHVRTRVHTPPRPSLVLLRTTLFLPKRQSSHSRERICQSTGQVMMPGTFLSDKDSQRQKTQCPRGLGPVLSTLAAHGNHRGSLKNTEALVRP